jgi:hypothetical protein
VCQSPEAGRWPVDSTAHSTDRHQTGVSTEHEIHGSDPAQSGRRIIRIEKMSNSRKRPVKTEIDSPQHHVKDQQSRSDCQQVRPHCCWPSGVTLVVREYRISWWIECASRVTGDLSQQWFVGRTDPQFVTVPHREPS